MNRSILHCDMNNFYASVECMLDPSLRKYPVAVCGSVEERHGIVLAKNYAAKAFDVKTGDAVWQAKQKCKDLVVVPPHYEEYIIEPFDYDDELLTAHHPELVVDSFEESFLRNETCQKVRSALATLQDVQKERVIKYFFDGKSTHEIAQEEGVSHQAVSQSIAVALKKL